VATEVINRNTAIGVETTRAQNAEALLAPLASPALTGSPTAPTQSAADNTTKIATDAYVTTAVANEATARNTAIGVETSRATTAEALLAPLASPALTGNPTVPTQSALTNSTRAASTAYTDAAVAVEVSRAGTAEALKAPLASPALTGTPTAPTAAAATNSTQVATTAYADAADTAMLTAAKTITSKRITSRVLALSAGSATPAINTDSYDAVNITAQSAAITSFTTNLTGTPVDGDQLFISVTDDGTARAITWGAKFEAGIVPLPVTTVISTRLDVQFAWNTATSKWRSVVATFLDSTSGDITTSAVGDAAAAGTNALAARADHKHAREAFGSGASTVSAVGDSAADGSNTTLARSDHRHGREGFGAVTAQTSFGASSANGTATTEARSDHTHGTPAVPTTASTQSALDNSTNIATTAYADAATAASLTATKTLTNKRITKRTLALSAASATPAINTDSYDVVHITSQGSTAITSFTTNLTGTPVDGDTLRISITGSGVVALTWGASFEASTMALPTTTVAAARLDVGFFWNTETSKWRCVGAA
jgi:hypothetical protein